MKVIKTNLSIAGERIVDHQSYVQEEKDWESFVKNVKAGIVFSKHKKIEVSNIVHDDYHLSCEVFNDKGWITKHLAYIEGRVVTE